MSPTIAMSGAGVISTTVSEVPRSADRSRTPSRTDTAPESSRFDDYLERNDDAATDADNVDAEQATGVADPVGPADEPYCDDSATRASDLVATLLQTLMALPRGPVRDLATQARDASMIDDPSGAAVSAVSAAEAAISQGLATTITTSPSIALATTPSVPAGGDASGRAVAAAADVTTLTDRAVDTAALDALIALTTPPPPPSATAPGSVVQTATPSLPTAPGQAADPLAEQIVWMTDHAKLQSAGVSEARINLHPAELGSLQIRVQIDASGGTKVSFDVETPQARQAIEASLPQLRELLSTQVVTATPPSFELSGGLSQQQQSASDAQQRALAQQRTQQVTAADADAGDVAADNAVITLRSQRVRVGLLDQFA